MALGSSPDASPFSLLWPCWSCPFRPPLPRQPSCPRPWLGASSKGSLELLETDQPRATNAKAQPKCQPAAHSHLVGAGWMEGCDRVAPVA